MIFNRKRLAKAGFLALLLFLLMVAVNSHAQQLEKEAVNRGLDYANLGKYEEAIEEFTRAIESNPRNAVAYYNRGLTYHKIDRQSQALSDYNKAIDINSKDPEVYYNRGIVKYNMGNSDDAVSDWSRALELDPEIGEIYQKRAYVYFIKKEYDKTWKDVHKLEELGYRMESNFLQQLKKASGREK